jgi:hypothetical protein
VPHAGVPVAGRPAAGARAPGRDPVPRLLHRRLPHPGPRPGQAALAPPGPVTGGLSPGTPASTSTPRAFTERIVGAVSGGVAGFAGVPALPMRAAAGGVHGRRGHQAPAGPGARPPPRAGTGPVAMCVNDLGRRGRPALFFDYLAVGRLTRRRGGPRRRVVRACEAVGCALLGGGRLSRPASTPRTPRPRRLRVRGRGARRALGPAPGGRGDVILGLPSPAHANGARWCAPWWPRALAPDPSCSGAHAPLPGRPGAPARGRRGGTRRPTSPAAACRRTCPERCRRVLDWPSTRSWDRPAAVRRARVRPGERGE